MSFKYFLRYFVFFLICNGPTCHWVLFSWFLACCMLCTCMHLQTDPKVEENLFSVIKFHPLPCLYLHPERLFAFHRHLVWTPTPAPHTHIHTADYLIFNLSMHSSQQPIFRSLYRTSLRTVLILKRLKNKAETSAVCLHCTVCLSEVW